MGAVLGIAAFGRTQEKLGGANNGGIQTPAPTTGFASGSSTFSQPQSGFGAAPGGFGSPAASTSFTAAPAASGGFQSKPMPAVTKPMDTGPLDSDFMPPRE
jgi:hypothetical protein